MRAPKKGVARAEVSVARCSAWRESGLHWGTCGCAVPACWHQHRYVRAALHPGWEGRARQLARKKPSGYLALCWAEVEGLPAVPRLWRYPYMLSHLPGCWHKRDCGSGFEQRLQWLWGINCHSQGKQCHELSTLVTHLIHRLMLLRLN